MSLAESLSAPKRPAKGPRCTVARIVAKLSGADLEAFTAALANPDYTASGISQALADEDLHLHESTIQRHRRGACSCGTR